MPSEVAVNLTGNEKKLINALAKSEAEFRKLSENAGRTNAEIEAGVNKMVKAAIGGMHQAHVGIDKMLKELKRIGPEGKEAFKAFEKYARETGEMGRRPVEEIIKEFDKINPAAAEAMRGAVGNVRKLQEAAAQTDVSELINKLGMVEGESADLANRFRQEMVDAMIDSEGGIDGLTRRIEQMEPSMRKVTAQWRKDWRNASEAANRALGENIRTLRSIGKEGDRVADEIIREFQSAGRLSERAMERIFAPLDKSDTRIRGVMSRIRKSIKPVNDDLGKISKQIKGMGRMQLAGLITQFLDVNKVIEKGVQLLREQKEMMERGSESNTSIAEAQASAIANLSSLDPKVRKQLIGEFSRDLSNEFKLGKEGRVSVIKAIGDSQSSGATSVEQIKEAVRVAAELNKFSQDKIDESAAALIKAAVATGSNDLRSLASKIFAGQEKSQINDADKFLLVAPQAMSNARTRAMPGQEERAVFQSVALMAALSKAGGDTKGESSATAAIQTAEAINRVFDLFEERTDKARKDLDALRAEGPNVLSASDRLTLSDLQSRQVTRAQTDAEAQRLTEAIAEKQVLIDNSQGAVRSRFSNEQRELREELRKTRQRQFSDDDAARLSDLTERQLKGQSKFAEKEAQLLAQIKEGVVNGRDVSSFRTGNPLDDLNFIRDSGRGQLAYELLGVFGEQRFQGGNRQLFLGGEAANAADAFFSEIERSSGSARVNQIIQEKNKGATREMRAEAARLEAEGREAQQDSENIALTRLINFRKEFANVKRETRGTSATGLARDAVGDMFSMSTPAMIELGIGLRGDNVVSEALDAVFQVADRLNSTRADAMRDNEIDARERAQIQRLEGFNGSIRTMFQESDLGSYISRNDLQESLATARSKIANERTMAKADDGVIDKRERDFIGMLEQIAGGIQEMIRVNEQQLSAQEDIVGMTAETADNTRPQALSTASAQQAANAARGI